MEEWMPDLLPFMMDPAIKCKRDGVTLLLIPENEFSSGENLIKLCYECGHWAYLKEVIENFGLVSGRAVFSKEEIDSIINRGFVFAEE